ncbi:flagellar FliJ family protein [Fodinicurvata sediminis]|uniref:flagellar FliJ family protein n=1 Tax=Fodinicurvata sediminis TaxID=1121832 RepID=UPI0003B44990|nr:flagellar FliJ family protein [Fodinicurvata sediminis]
MNGLENLVRLKRWKLDEQRRALADLEALEERLRADLERLEEEIAQEKEAANADQEGNRVFPFYAANALKRRERLWESLNKVSAETLQARDAVAEAFEEVKRYEQTLENMAQRRQESRRKREQKEMDEIGLRLHRQRGNDGK